MVCAIKLRKYILITLISYFGTLVLEIASGTLFLCYDIVTYFEIFSDGDDAVYGFESTMFSFFALESLFGPEDVYDLEGGTFSGICKEIISFLFN